MSSQCSLQVTLLSHLKGIGWGNLPRLLGNFTPLFLFNDLFGWQGFLLMGLGFRQLGLIETGDFPPMADLYAIFLQLVESCSKLVLQFLPLALLQQETYPVSLN